MPEFYVIEAASPHRTRTKRTRAVVPPDDATWRYVENSPERQAAWEAATTELARRAQPDPLQWDFGRNLPFRPTDTRQAYRLASSAEKVNANQAFNLTLTALSGESDRHDTTVQGEVTIRGPFNDLIRFDLSNGTDTQGIALDQVGRAIFRSQPTDTDLGVTGYPLYETLEIAVVEGSTDPEIRPGEPLFVHITCLPDNADEGELVTVTAELKVSAGGARDTTTNGTLTLSEQSGTGQITPVAVILASGLGSVQTQRRSGLYYYPETDRQLVEDTRSASYTVKKGAPKAAAAGKGR